MTVPLPQLPAIEEDALWSLFTRADEIGLRLELSRTGITWEAQPGLRHQEILAAVFESVRNELAGKECECYRAIDVAIRLRDGSVKRPDISIFYRGPSDEEGFVHAVPEAVVEITSPGYEDKDLVWGPPLYLNNGVKDVLVLDRRTEEVHRWQGATRSVHAPPFNLQLLCGCTLTI